MRTQKLYGFTLAFLACGTWLVPPQAAFADSRGKASNRVAPKLTLREAELAPQGKLSGVLVDAPGQPLTNQVVLAEPVNKPRARKVETTTDSRGRFNLVGVEPGIYAITAGDRLVVCRCWAPSTAPPSAPDKLLLVRGHMIERGQQPIADLLAGPVLIGLIIAAAVAIPIAIHNSDNDAT